VINKFTWLFILAFWLPKAVASGFQTLQLQDPQDKPFTLAVWYPSQVPAPENINTPFRQRLALDAQPSPGRYPLVVISHGYGGWFASHAATAKALSEAGFIVAAPTHTGNNYQDESYPPSRWMVDRPRHIKLAIDHLLKQWPNRASIDQQRIGLFGFSAGGYSVLASIGAKLDVEKIRRHCAIGNELVCRLGLREDRQLTAAALEKIDTDNRVRAAVVAAPGIGFGFTSASLAEVDIPLAVWSAERDHNVPYDSNIKPLQQYLPKSVQFHSVAKAGHFIFMPPCNPKLEALRPAVWDKVCVDHPSLNREQFQHRFNGWLSNFFERKLLATGG